MRTDIDTIYIGGEWITTLSTSRIEIRSPSSAARAACCLVGSQQIRQAQLKIPVRRFRPGHSSQLAVMQFTGEIAVFR